MLARRGCKAIRTFYRNDVGWIIDFRAGKRRLEARVNWLEGQTGKYQLGLWQRSWIAGILGLKSFEYVEALRRLNTELAKDPRFHDARWFSEREIQSGADGVLSPVED
jgi:hypothetical protein